jgi:hypothetical protein
MKNSASGPTNTVSPMPVVPRYGLGALRRRARIARVELAGARIDDVAEEYQHVGGAERVDIGGVEIRLKDHVAFVDRLPAWIEDPSNMKPSGELVLVDDRGHHRKVLPLPLGSVNRRSTHSISWSLIIRGSCPRRSPLKLPFRKWICAPSENRRKRLKHPSQPAREASSRR